MYKYFNLFSPSKHLDALWGLQQLVGETQSVCLDPTQDPAHWWMDPPAQPQRRTLRISSAWFAKAATMWKRMSQ